MHGVGTMIWPDQSRFEGDFLNGKIEGRGTKYFSNGNKYIGQWKDDAMHGSGVWFSLKDQTKRQGQWQNNKRTQWIGNPQETHIS